MVVRMVDLPKHDIPYLSIEGVWEHTSITGLGNSILAYCTRQGTR